MSHEPSPSSVPFVDLATVARVLGAQNTAIGKGQGGCDAFRARLMISLAAPSTAVQSNRSLALASCARGSLITLHPISRNKAMSQWPRMRVKFPKQSQAPDVADLTRGSISRNKASSPWPRAKAKFPKQSQPSDAADLTHPANPETKPRVAGRAQGSNSRNKPSTAPGSEHRLQVQCNAEKRPGGDLLRH